MRGPLPDCAGGIPRCEQAGRGGASRQFGAGVEWAAEQVLAVASPHMKRAAQAIQRLSWNGKTARTSEQATVVDPFRGVSCRHHETAAPGCGSYCQYRIGVGIAGMPGPADQ